MKHAGDSEDALSLISSVSVLKRKSEEQGEHKKLREIIKYSGKEKENT